MNYNQILEKITHTIAQTQQNINQEKVLMAWKIGEIIEEFLDNNSNYGSKLIYQLQADLNISQSTLYQMRALYNAYPNLNQTNIKLNWSHYRTLITIKDDEQRQRLENIALENSLNARDLQQKALLTKTTQSAPNKKLMAKRGELFHYHLTTIAGSDDVVIDCGFKNFTKINTNLSAPLNVITTKDANGNMMLKKSPNTKAKFYTYKAYLEYVVDGDTLRVVLDLGFNIYHKEIIRLKGVNAAESKTVAGKKSTNGLKKILEDVPFLVIKSNQTDIYGRYVGDVFFAQDEMDAHKVAKHGVYLNQLLLDEGLVDLV